MGQRSKQDFPSGSVVKNLPATHKTCRRSRFSSWVGKIPGVGNGNPLQYFCLENPTDKEVWWVSVPGVTKSQT